METLRTEKQVPHSRKSRHLFLLIELSLEVDVDVVDTLVGRIAHLLHSPVLAVTSYFEIEGAVSQNLLPVVDVVDFRPDISCEDKVILVHYLDSAIEFHVVAIGFTIVIGITAVDCQLLALAGESSIGFFLDGNRAKVIPRDPLQAEHVTAYHFAFKRSASRVLGLSSFSCWSPLGIDSACSGQEHYGYE